MFQNNANRLLYFHFKNNCLVRFEPTTGSQQRPRCGRETRRRGEERERGQRSARASAAMGAIRLLHERLRHSSNAKLAWSITGVMSTLLVYGFMQVKKRVLFSAYLGFSILSRCLSFSLAVELAAGSRK